MRHFTSRSVIYTIIGIGLFLLAISQFRKGEDASNASFVANSNPFDALKGYQPGTEPAKIEPDSTPIADEKETILRLPNFVEAKVESTESVIEDITNSAQFTNMPNDFVEAVKAEVKAVEVAASQLTQPQLTQPHFTISISQPTKT